MKLQCDDTICAFLMTGAVFAEQLRMHGVMVKISRKYVDDNIIISIIYLRVYGMQQCCSSILVLKKLILPAPGIEHIVRSIQSINIKTIQPLKI